MSSPSAVRSFKVRYFSQRRCQTRTLKHETSPQAQSSAAVHDCATPQTFSHPDTWPHFTYAFMSRLSHTSESKTSSFTSKAHTMCCTPSFSSLTTQQRGSGISSKPSVLLKARVRVAFHERSPSEPTTARSFDPSFLKPLLPASGLSIGNKATTNDNKINNEKGLDDHKIKQVRT